ncbi:Flp pilus assembly protein CpaB [Rhodosalinus sp. K401]|uniref:Flp pilus assembly protein CpaB n=1 Tax=Rhodosalinus sp. K401 TaxID=3239195 RepID=UPI0035241478
MRLVFGLVLILGLALAGGAVFMAKNYIEGYQTALAQERAARPAPVPTEEVFVAARALKYGEILTPEDVRTVAWPKAALPEGVFLASAGSLFDEGEDRPRTVTRAMEENEAILAVKVTEPGEAAGLTTRLPRGMRAFAIKVDVASGVSGFLRPGDRVDIYWTGRAVGSGGGDMTKLIETGVELIAVDQSADSAEISDTTIARTVTVAAWPQQVAALAQAQSTGRLALSLVGVNDDTVAEAIEVDQMELLGIEKPEPTMQKSPEKEVCTVRTRRGNEVVEIPIPCTN